ncbi:hypothetical protein D3C77_569960 [compost metagenome]
MDVPALLISKVTSFAMDAAVATDSELVMSSCTGIAPGISTDSGFLAPAYTLAPRCKSSIASFLPKPRFAPLTSATCCEISILFSSFFCVSIVT